MSQSLNEALESAVQVARGMSAPLADRLGHVADAVRALSPVFADAVERMVARQLASGAGQAAPAVGEAMPPFALPDDTGQLVTLDGLLAGGPAVISFNRGHWCPYCRLATQALAEAQERIAGLGGSVAVIVPERRRFAAALKTESDAAFPVLTDMDNGYAVLLNLAIWVGAEMQDMMTAAGWDIARFQGNTTWCLPVPATFVVTADGIVAARFIDPDYRRRAEADSLLAAIASLPA